MKSGKLAVLLLASVGFAQDDLSRERLIAAGKLWVTVQYFHPFLAWKGVDWDRAFLQAIPRIQAAKDRNEYAQAIDDMLRELGDSGTHVQKIGEAPPAQGLGFTEIQLRDDGVLLAKTGRANGDPMDSASKFPELFAKAKSVVFDLRAGAAHPWLLGGLPLSTKPLTLPGYRFRMQNGLHPDRGGWGAPYFSGSWTRDAAVLQPNPAGRKVPVVFVVGNDSQLPDIASALQDAGHGYVVAENPIEAARINASFVKITDDVALVEGIRARIRLGEVLHADGSSGMCADKISSAEALDEAIQLALAPPSASCQRVNSPQPKQRVNEEYRGNPYPSAAHRLLSAFRIWGVFEFLFPYRDLMDEDWEDALRRALPRIEGAKDAREYHLAVSELVSRVQDTHAVVSSEMLTQIRGVARAGVAVRHVEGEAVVSEIFDPAATQAGMNVGDLVKRVNGIPVPERIRELSRYISASTPQALMRDAMDFLIRGGEGREIVLSVAGSDGVEREVRLICSSKIRRTSPKADQNESIRMLPDNIGYMDLRQLGIGDIDGAFERLRNSKAIIFDMRGYPRNTRAALGSWLSKRPQIISSRMVRKLAFSPDTKATEEREGRQQWTLDPAKHYGGPTVLLIDERAQSQSEATGMVLRAANGTRFVGSHTAGANGDGSSFFVPGGIRIGLTGQGVVHPDGRQLQRIGLVPDIAVTPTINGMRQGRDEVLDRAVALINTGK